MRIRPATVDDADGIEAVRVAGWRAAYAGIVPQSFLDAMTPGDPHNLARRRVQLSDPALWCLVADSGTGLRGYMVCGPERSSASEGEIYALYVDPGHWSTGLGFALFQGAVGRLRAAGHARCGLWVLERNQRARAFYERCGMSLGTETATVEFGATLTEVRYEMGLRE